LQSTLGIVVLRILWKKIWREIQISSFWLNKEASKVIKMTVEKAMLNVQGCFSMLFSSASYWFIYGWEWIERADLHYYSNLFALGQEITKWRIATIILFQKNNFLKVSIKEKWKFEFPAFSHRPLCGWWSELFCWLLIWLCTDKEFLTIWGSIRIYENGRKINFKIFLWCRAKSLLLNFFCKCLYFENVYSYPLNGTMVQFKI